MHPGMIGWWHARRLRAAAMGMGCGPRHGHGGGGDEGGWQAGPGGWGGGWGGGDEGGAFGVRRPLRFLAYKLGLSESQVNALARILNDLKTERAQAAVDNRRAVAALADAIAGEAFDAAKAQGAAGDRVKSAEKLRDALVKALGEIHGLLQPGQREQLAYLIRTGALML